MAVRLHNPNFVYYSAREYYFGHLMHQTCFMWLRTYNRMHVVSVAGLNHEQHISKYAIIYGVEDLRMWTSQNRDSDLFAVKKEEVRIKITNHNFVSCCIWA